MPKVTELIEASGKEPRAMAELFALVYEELRQLAAGHLAQEKAGHTLQPTALVHEAYLRLVGTAPPTGQSWNGRAHFFGAAAEAMRRILVDAARRKNAVKRGGNLERRELDPDQIAAPELSEDLLALDEALDRLAQIDASAAQLVHLRYFAGLTIREAAEILGIAPRTADLHWAYARAWLLSAIGTPPASPEK